MAPASRPASSWLPASDGPTVSTGGLGSKAIGSAPNFRLVARPVASDSEKSPLISARPLVMTPFMVGAEMTCPSRTMANCLPVSTSAREISVKVEVPSLSKLSVTTQPTCCCGTTASADWRSVPSIIEGDSRYLTPWSSHVTSG